MPRNKQQDILHHSNLGQQTEYTDQYNPKLLFPIPRQLKRDELGIESPLPFHGSDIWNDYETSWLNLNGKPLVAITEFQIPCTSPNIIESKSIKLYLNSFSNSQFESDARVQQIIQNDLSKIAGAHVDVAIRLLDANESLTITAPSGSCIDTIDTKIEHYHAQPDYLCSSDEPEISETLYSNLLKSNCPVTNQPDWATLIISYKGAPINREGLLKYIVSLRNQQEFHEQCIERVFINIMHYCKPSELTVIGRYTRRGGKDINPIRSTNPDVVTDNQRLIRQ